MATVRTKRNPGRAVLLTCLIIGACRSAAAGAPAELDAYRVDPSAITVSGISAGGYMAGQLHVAYSTLISGAGLLAAGPYRCAEGSLEHALSRCLTGEAMPVAELVARTRRAAAAGDIDDPAHLRGDRVWIFHGSEDTVIRKGVTDALVDYYRAFLTEEDIVYVTGVAAAHGFPARDHGGACNQLAPAFLNDCGYDAAGQMFAHLYGPLKPLHETTAPLRSFSQQPFQAHAMSLSDYGYLYVPEACADGAACRLHVVLHGCRQSAEFVGEEFARFAGFNEWAEANDIIVLYPQLAASENDPVNPNGCWDWWGYSGQSYADRSGGQLVALKRMIDRLRGA